MKTDDRSAKLAAFDTNTRNVLGLCALGDKGYSRRDLHRLAGNAGWRGKSGRKLSSKEISDIVNTLLETGFLQYGSYQYVQVDEEIQDWVVQELIRNGGFNSLANIVQEADAPWYHRNSNPRRDLRIAFYKGDFDTFLKGIAKSKELRATDFLRPFSRDIFDSLPEDIRRWYLIETVPRVLTTCASDPLILTLFEELIESGTVSDLQFFATWLDLAVAQGSLESLQMLDEVSVGKHNEVRGCIELLKGDVDQGMALLGPVMPGGKRRGKLGAALRLPGLLASLVWLSKGGADAFERIDSAVRIGTSKNARYGRVMYIVGRGAAFMQSPASAKAFTSSLQCYCDSPLETLVVGYLSRWLFTTDDVQSDLKGLEGAAEQLSAFGLSWFEAEAYGIAGKSRTAVAKNSADRSREIHSELGTSSLVDLSVPEPAWRRALNAVAALAEEDVVGEAAPSSASERLIWEWDTRGHSIDLTPFYQKQTRSGWSGGRKVGLARLYDNFSDSAEFGFLTEEDLAICRTLEMSTWRSYRGYPETSYSFSDNSVARALVGHPRVFVPGDRERPMEIVERTPQLKISKTTNGDVAVSIDPEPDDSAASYRMQVESTHKVTFVFFSNKQLRVHHTLGGTLTAPSDAADQVMASVQKLTSLISVHSEIGEVTHEGKTIAADAVPHIHLTPYLEGLKAEFFVYPFGDEGPSYQPGQGGDNIFARINGIPTTTVRDSAKELDGRDAILEACPGLSSHSEDGISFCLATAEDALSALAELEAKVESKEVVLHWPRGKRLSLAGQVSTDSLHLKIRKDGDYFAASGSLSVNSELTLDLLQLIDLLEVRPSRFVELNDGRFLALTEALQRRIEELSLYGDRHSKQNALRFPKVRATVLEALDATIGVKSDKHWKEWVKRIQGSNSLDVAVPHAVQADLRDYQQEGFLWSARLADWGVGALLADDMGLGKTLQALALLVHRASKGPSLVVAPTSVAYNWKREAERFTPTLKVSLFGDGDRTEQVGEAGPFDVLVCTYGLLNTEAERLRSTRWGTLILDEAQLIKNEATARSRAAKNLNADFKLMLTGTPVENDLSELWNLFDFLNPGLLGTRKQFQERFSVPIETQGCAKTRRSLKRLIQPFILRRTKAQVLDALPPRTEIVRKVVLTDEETALYEALRRRALEKLDEIGGAGPGHIQILAEIMRLRRACCHPQLVLDDWAMPSAKLTLFSETIDELLANRHKVLVFSQFVDHLAILKKDLEQKGIAYQYLDGSTPKAQRKTSIDAFQSGEGDVFLISLKAGGLGLNLTAADYVIHMDPWWNPAVEDQASDRAHRLGQKRPVTIYRFITQGTVEEKIAALHSEKRALADSLLEGSDLSGKLSAEELLGLIRE